ncbi:hypothetical protein HDV05_001029 [Chytridiales sp. JEL 0842]|nr:hypothetical protein HDV05_001029 [Chytridiales sp. JEL 0842]
MLLVKASTTLATLLIFRGIYLYIKAHLRARAFKRLNPTMTVITATILPQSPMAWLGLVPKWLMNGYSWDWDIRLRYKAFKGSHLDTLAFVGPSETVVHVANPDLCREIMVNRWTEFPKPTHLYYNIDMFGKNVVTLEGKDWRRHRKIASPQFSERNNHLVHEETVRVVEDMFQAWSKQPALPDGGVVADVTRDMMHLALSVISAASFGVRFEWDSENVEHNIPEGHQMPFQHAVETFLRRIPVRMVTPEFLYKLPIKYLRDTKLANDEFHKYLLEFIEKSKKSETGGDNLLNLLVKAAEKEEQGQGLSEVELTGNAFVFMVAGHETTAGSLVYALTHLAINPDIQETLYREVVSVIGTKEAPMYTQFHDFPYAQAIMHEAMRMNAPISLIPKWTGEQSQTLGPFILPPRTGVNITTYGLHFNESAWGTDAETFNPSRFLSDPTSVPKSNWNKDAHSPFSEGPRSCLGKKFAQVEFVCFLVMLAQRYTWRLQDGDIGEKVLESRSMLSTKPKKHVKLVFKRRDI